MPQHSRTHGVIGADHVIAGDDFPPGTVIESIEEAREAAEAFAAGVA